MKHAKNAELVIINPLPAHQCALVVQDQPTLHRHHVMHVHPANLPMVRIALTVPLVVTLSVPDRLVVVYAQQDTMVNPYPTV